jgi:predicted alpha-1,2-mannosidase
MKEAADYIDPMIGAITEHESTWAGLGKTYPGAWRPSGLVQVGPDTVTGGDNGSGYSAGHDSIEGFSFTHMSGIGAYGDLGNLLVTPTAGPLRTYGGLPDELLEETYRSRFSSDNEVAQAGYYAVTLDDPGIRAEATCTCRAGILRFTFPEHECGRIQIDLSRRVGGRSVEQFVRKVDNHTLEGWMRCDASGGGWRGGVDSVAYTVYFSLSFSRPLQTLGVWSVEVPEAWRGPWPNRAYEQWKTPAYIEAIRGAMVDALPASGEFQGEHIGIFAEWPTGAGEQIIVKAGISYVSIEGARGNLEAEMPHWGFDRVRADARADWNRATEALTDVEATEEQLTILRTAQYRTLCDPRCFADVDGTYPIGDGCTKQSSHFTRRTVFSGWDVFRSQFPWLTLAAPDTVNDMVCSLIEVAETRGKGLPVWELLGCYTGCMLGDPGIVVIVDAYMKGIRNYDVEKAYALCRQSSLGPDTMRKGWQDFNELGYVSANVSATLENCHADACLALFAEALGKTKDALLFRKRAQNYRNIFDPEIGLMRPKDENGDWHPWVGATEMGAGSGCVESNSLQQSFFVPHDTEGLVALMGADRYLATLTGLFESTPEGSNWNDYYNHPNEPVHTLPFLFNKIGKPALTQKWSRWAAKCFYGTGIFGLNGNEDVGQMSAWYVLAAIGLHPINTGDGIYQITSPVVKRATIRLHPDYHRGESFTIIAENNSDANIYIQSATLNDQPLDRFELSYEEITNGGELRLIMGHEPGVVSERVEV